MENYNTNDKEAVEIRQKLKKLSEKNSEIMLNDVISIEEVRKYEAEHNVTLPEDYVWFITNVGNGGKWMEASKGVAYLFYDLERAPYAYEAVNGYDKGRENFALCVLSKGCSYFFGIIMMGEHYGEIARVGENIAFCHNKTVCRNFKELYVKWLNEAYLGYCDLKFEIRHYGTIEENLEQFRNGHDYDVLYSIYCKVNEQCVSEQFISDVHDLYLSEKDIVNKEWLAKTLLRMGYTDGYSVLCELFSLGLYETFQLELLYQLEYFKDSINDEFVMEGAEKYYSMLVHILKYYLEFHPKMSSDFKTCFSMVVMNPEFNENDIIDVLNSDDEYVIEYLSYVFQKSVKERVGKYLDVITMKYKALAKKNSQNK